jgi:pimeloyl-ACP methyl ester carboxylesterase
MAADRVGLLDALKLDSAHIVGASLGGMVAQTITIEYPDRIRSLTSMFSTTGDRGRRSGRLRSNAIQGKPPSGRVVRLEGCRDRRALKRARPCAA